MNHSKRQLDEDEVITRAKRSSTIARRRTSRNSDDIAPGLRPLEIPLLVRKFDRPLSNCQTDSGIRHLEAPPWEPTLRNYLGNPPWEPNPPTICTVSRNGNHLTALAPHRPLPRKHGPFYPGQNSPRPDKYIQNINTIKSSKLDCFSDHPVLQAPPPAPPHPVSSLLLILHLATSTLVRLLPRCRSSMSTTPLGGCCPTALSTSQVASMQIARSKPARSNSVSMATVLRSPRAVS